MFDCRLLQGNVLAIADFSVASNQPTNSCEVEMLCLIIVRNWASCITYVLTYFYKNSFAINFMM